MKAIALVALALALAGCADAPTAPQRRSLPPSVTSARAGVAPTHVVFIAGRPAGRAIAAARRLGITPSVVWSRALDGFGASLTPSDSSALVAAGATVRRDAVRFYPDMPFGIDRIDQRDLPLDGVYAPFRTNGGAGVTAYVIDTGIETTHPEFGGRASWGADFTGQGFADCRGHGTHVAGTLGGATVGVASQVHLVAIRVFGCADGADEATMLAAIEWVVTNATHPAVVNMSLSGPANTPDAITAAVENMVASGLTVAAAAGNNAGADACAYSPAQAPSAITVMATFSIRDNIATFSNAGPCGDLFAPGYAIESAFLNGGYTALNGTSMATPHVAGAAALLLSATPSLTPAQVTAALFAESSPNIIKGDMIAGTPNRMLYVGDPAIEPPRCKGKGCPKAARGKGVR